MALRYPLRPGAIMTDASSTAPMRAPAGDDDLKGIGGWLILPIIHLVANMGMIAYEVVVGFMQGGEIQEGGPSETSFSTVVAGFSAMSDGEKVAVGFFFYSVFVFLYAAFCLIQLLRQKRSVPKLMIGFYLLLAIMVVGSYWVVNAYADTYADLGITEEDKTDAVMGLIRVGIACAVWIPYFLVSKRVKNTFVN